jgi:hypothetical protein
MSHDPLRPSPDPAPTNSPHDIVPVQENLEKDNKTRASADARANERQVLPENRLWIVFPGLMCCIFLAALDQVCSQLCLFLPSACLLQQTIVATALPTIVQHLGEGNNYSWVGRYLTFFLPCSL